MDGTHDKSAGNTDGASHDEELHAFGEEALDDAADTGTPQPVLALEDDERLPWLESADDEDDDPGADTGRLLRMAIVGLVLVVAVIGAIWFAGQRSADGVAVADGGVIKAPARPYKEVPPKQGGKTFAGTGDSAFSVSEGKTTPARLDQGDAPAPVAASDAASAAPAGAVGVQVAAYSSQASAEAGWTRLSGSHEALKGLNHRVVEGTADIGTVYRLQALAPNAEAANALCASLKASGLACQVKR